MLHITSRLPDVGTTIFDVMTKMANENGAINLSQGFPDFEIDPKLIGLVNHFMTSGFNQYATMPGVAPLRKILADLIRTSYQREVSWESDITITSGATEGIYACISAFISPGDEVILFDPAYDSYDPAIRLNGGTPVQINLTYPGYRIDWDLVKKKITSRTRMIMIKTPHNPTGSVLKRSDLEELERIALRHRLIVLSDEVYDRLMYDGLQHQSVLTMPGLASQSLAIFSFGKTFHATGWKMGYVVAPEHLSREVRKTHQFIVYSVNTPIQYAFAEYLKTPEHYTGLGRFYQEKRDFFLSTMAGSSFEPLKTEGSYFQLFSYRNIARKSDVEMAEEMTRKHKVACIPVSVFYKDKTDNGLLRFCFAKKEQTLEKAASILRGM
ncbi:MAG TPA: methionine aminotransferase [Chryseosolibacter sp.]|nr:methionine aminotransferase [Chryseosolibacter sp.]